MRTIKENGKFSDYGLTQLLVTATINRTESSASKWLDNDFYGTTFSAIYKNEKVEMIFLVEDTTSMKIILVR
jgi:iron complex outermembrane receptor protein